MEGKLLQRRRAELPDGHSMREIVSLSSGEELRRALAVLVSDAL
jgi:hypothetical protein